MQINGEQDNPQADIKRKDRKNLKEWTGFSEYSKKRFEENKKEEKSQNIELGEQSPTRRTDYRSQLFFVVQDPQFESNFPTAFTVTIFVSELSLQLIESCNVEDATENECGLSNKFMALAKGFAENSPSKRIEKRRRLFFGISNKNNESKSFFFKKNKNKIRFNCDSSCDTKRSQGDTGA